MGERESRQNSCSLSATRGFRDSSDCPGLFLACVVLAASCLRTSDEPLIPPGRSLRRAGWAESCQPQLESYKACVSDLDATNLSNHLKPSQIALLSVHLVKSPGGLFF